VLRRDMVGRAVAQVAGNQNGKGGRPGRNACALASPDRGPVSVLVSENEGKKQGWKIGQYHRVPKILPHGERWSSLINLDLSGPPRSGEERRFRGTFILP